MKSGRQTRPASVYNRNSFSRISRTTETSAEISSYNQHSKTCGQYPSTKTSDSGDKMDWISMDSQPHSIHKHLCSIRRRTRIIILQILHPPFLEKLNDRSRRTPHRNITHQRQILNQPTSLSLWRLGRTHQPPMRIMQLSRFRHFALSPNRRIRPS